MSADQLPYHSTIQSVRTALETTLAEVDAWFDKPSDLRAERPSTRGWTIDEVLEPIARHGSFSWSRPEHMVPTGKPASAEVRQRMREQLQECLDLLAGLSHGEGSLFHVRMSVHDSGKLDVYQWLYFLAQHARRHIAQMEENEQEAGIQGWEREIRVLC